MAMSISPRRTRAIRRSAPSTTTKTRTPGCVSANRQSMCGRNRSATSPGAPSRTSPRTDGLTKREITSRFSASMRRACSTRIAPSAVMLSERLLRTKSGRPTMSSILRTCIETADGVRCTALAAAEKLPVSAMAARVRSKSRSKSGMVGVEGAVMACASFRISDR